MKRPIGTLILADALLAALVQPLRAQIVSDGAAITLSNVTNTFAGDVTVGTNGSGTLLILASEVLLTNSANGLIGRNATASRTTGFGTRTTSARSRPGR